MQPDGKINRIFLVGLVGGLLLLLLLWHPLAVVLPMVIAGTGAFGLPPLAIGGLAAGIVAATGYAAAHFAGYGTHRANMLVGLVAGVVASAVAYFGVGGAAAGLVGNLALVEHGLVAATNPEMMRLFAASVIGSINWTVGALWGSLAAGGALGALAGSLTTRRAAQDMPDARGLRRILFPVVSLAIIPASMNMLMMVAFSLMPEALRRASIEYGLGMTESMLQSVFTLPLFTAALPYLGLLLALAGMMRAEARTENPTFWARRPLGLLMALATLVLPVAGYTVMLYPSVATLAVSAAAVGLLGLFAAAALRLRGRMLAQNMAYPLTQRHKAGLALLGIGLPLTLFAAVVIPGIALLGVAMAAAGLVITVREDRAVAKDAKLKSAAGGMVESYQQSYLGSVVTVSFITLMNIQAALVLVMIAVRMLPALVNTEAPATFTVSEMINELFTLQLQLMPVVFAVVFGAMSTVTLIAWLVYRWQRRGMAALPATTSAGAAVVLPSLTNKLNDEDEDEDDETNMYSPADKQQTAN